MAPTSKTSTQKKALPSSSSTNQKKKTKARVQRYLKSTEPQVREPHKNRLLLKGIRCSQSMQHILQEVRAVTAPHSKLFGKKNQIVAFETYGQQSLEFLCQKNDAALFGLASHNKKRPNHLTIGRTFDHQILDLAELAILRFKSMQDYGGSVPKKRIGSKPLLLFVGDVWQQQLDYRNLQNLLVDFYRGDVVDKLVVSGLDHVMVFTAAADATTTVATTTTGAANSSSCGRVLIHQRTYFCKLKKAETTTTSSSAAAANNNNTTAPVPFLMPCGPDLDFSLRRTQWADADLYKASRKQPASLRRKSKHHEKHKNKSTNLFGETIGRLHLEKQNVDKMGGRKSKALRRAEKIAADEEAEAIEQDLETEKQQGRMDQGLE